MLPAKTHSHDHSHGPYLTKDDCQWSAQRVGGWLLGVTRLAVSGQADIGDVRCPAVGISYEAVRGKQESNESLQVSMRFIGPQRSDLPLNLNTAAQAHINREPVRTKLRVPPREHTP